MHSARKKRSCLRCGQKFNSENKFNRLCEPCRRVNRDSVEGSLAYGARYSILAGGRRLGKKDSGETENGRDWRSD